MRTSLCNPLTVNHCAPNEDRGCSKGIAYKALASLLSALLSLIALLFACPSELSMPRLAIIGSGVAGLAAASTLHDQGFDFTLFEADAHVGGHAHTVLVRPLIASHFE